MTPEPARSWVRRHPLRAGDGRSGLAAFWRGVFRWRIDWWWLTVPVILIREWSIRRRVVPAALRRGSPS